MNDKMPTLTTGKNQQGITKYTLWAAPAWDGYDSLIQYLQKHWQAEINEYEDKIYSRRAVLRCQGVPISVYHDGHLGNYFLREDGIEDQLLLESIVADLIKRLSTPTA